MNFDLAKRISAFAVLGMGASLSGCAYIVADMEEAPGVPLSELDVSAPAPERIQLAGPDNIIITPGDDFVLTVEGSEEAIEALRFERSGDRLSIAREYDVYDGSGRATVRITMPAPEELGVAGSGRIESTTLAQQADLEIAGSGDIIVTGVDSTDIDVDIAGSGSVTAAGTAQQLDISIAGSGDVNFNELDVREASVDIAGSGDVALASNGSVTANIAGSGDVVVSGSATCTVNSVGSGTLTCLPPAIADNATAEANEETSDQEEAAAE